MQLRVVALIELNTSVSKAAHIEKELHEFVKTFWDDDDVLCTSVDTLSRRGEVCEDVSHITFRRKKYDPKTGKPV